MKKKLKGAIGKDMLIKLGLAIIVAGLLIIVISPLIQSASASGQTCGAFRTWIAELGGGNVQTC